MSVRAAGGMENCRITLKKKNLSKGVLYNMDSNKFHMDDLRLENRGKGAGRFVCGLFSLSYMGVN